MLLGKRVCPDGGLVPERYAAPHATGHCCGREHRSGAVGGELGDRLGRGRARSDTLLERAGEHLERRPVARRSRRAARALARRRALGARARRRGSRHRPSAGRGRPPRGAQRDRRRARSGARHAPLRARRPSIQCVRAPHWLPPGAPRRRPDPGRSPRPRDGSRAERRRCARPAPRGRRGAQGRVHPGKRRRARAGAGSGRGRARARPDGQLSAGARSSSDDAELRAGGSDPRASPRLPRRQVRSRAARSAGVCRADAGSPSAPPGRRAARRRAGRGRRVAPRGDAPGAPSKASGFPAVAACRRSTASVGRSRINSAVSSRRNPSTGSCSTPARSSRTPSTGRSASSRPQGLAFQPTRCEQQRLHRRVVDPVGIIDHRQQRRFLGGGGQNPERGRAHDQPIGHRRRADRQRALQRSPLHRR